MELSASQSTGAEMLIVNGFVLRCQNKHQDGVKNVGCRKIRKSWFCVVSYFSPCGVSCSIHCASAKCTVLVVKSQSLTR